MMKVNGVPNNQYIGGQIRSLLQLVRIMFALHCR